MKHKVITPHEFRAGETDDIKGRKVFIVNHHDHGELKETLPIYCVTAIQSRQIADMLNKVFKMGIGWGYNYSKVEGMTDERQMVLKESDVVMDVDLQVVS